MKKIIIALASSLFFLVVYILVDCSNFLSKSGLKIENINTDLLAITVSALTAFLVFYCTYQLIERWNVRKNDNLRKLGINLFRETLEECERYYKLLNGELLDHLVKQTDFERKYYGDSPANKYAHIPFKNEEVLIQCAIQGVVSPEIIMKYYEIKSSFSSYCMQKVLFRDDNDVKQFVEPAGEYFQSLLKEANKLLDDGNNEVK